MRAKVDHSLRECNWCGTLYKPASSHQNFCDKNCYRKYGKKFLGHSQGRRIHTPTEKKPKKFNYRQYKKKFCEYCKFIPIHPCQLDVDHIDGNHNNNKLENLQTLCSNCHRLKTHINRDILKPRPGN